MEELLKVMNAAGNSCGGCHSTGCGTCSPAPATSAAPVPLSRREFGYAALVASAGTILAGCSTQKPTEQASQPAAASATPAPPRALSPLPELVRESKGALWLDHWLSTPGFYLRPSRPTKASDHGRRGRTSGLRDLDALRPHRSFPSLHGWPHGRTGIGRGHAALHRDQGS